MPKRRADTNGTHETLSNLEAAEMPAASHGKKRKIAHDFEDAPMTVQIIIGTYEKVLHGVTAEISQSAGRSSGQNIDVEFADTFLLNAHSSAIRCLALSPPSGSAKSQKVVLASGGSDQIINLYHISTTPPSREKAKGPPIPTLNGNKVTENSRNRELGSLQHHGGSVCALHFPTRSKLLSAAEDNTIAVARTRDWTILSTIKAPIPKAHGRPSGDTAPLGGTPAGVNDFAIHPSMKLMVSVGRGEKCMRLWNLITGKKAAVLNFDRELLQGVGEGKWASGEGRKVEWNSVGEEFVVAFERGCVVYGIVQFPADSKPKCRILPSPTTKIHQLHYTNNARQGDVTDDILAVSTEDGRILFYSTDHTSSAEPISPSNKPQIPICEPLGQMAGAQAGLTGRIKDFQILQSSDLDTRLMVTGSSDGAIRVWKVDDAELGVVEADLDGASKGLPRGDAKNSKENGSEPSTVKQVGQLLGTYEAGNRITCLAAFLMSKPTSLESDQPDIGRVASAAKDEDGN